MDLLSEESNKYDSVSMSLETLLGHALVILNEYVFTDRRRQ